MAQRATTIAPRSRPPRVLVLAYHFPPEGSVGTHRTLRLVRQLSDRGWDVTVLTGTEATYSSGCVIDAELLARVPANVRVVRAPALRPVDRAARIWSGSRRASSGEGSVKAAAPSVDRPPSRGARLKKKVEALLRIPDHHAGWLLPAVGAGIAASAGQAPDVIYSTAPPWTGQLVARALAAFLRCPWVADFRDPWARAPWREDRLPVATRAAEWLERRVVRRADAVVFTTRTNMEENSAFYGTMSTKFHLVRNGCDRAEFQALAPLRRDNRFTLLHAGSMYGGRRPVALLSALAALRDRGIIDASSFCFRQIGRVSLAGFDLAAEAARLGLQGLVELVDTRPRREILREMLGASCLLLLQPGTTVSIPGKLFEYFAAGRPILAIAEEGETADLVSASGCGVAVLPDDQAGIERAVAGLVQSAAAGAAITPPPLELYDGELRTRQLVNILEQVSQRAAAPAMPPLEDVADSTCASSPHTVPGAQR